MAPFTLDTDPLSTPTPAASVTFTHVPQGNYTITEDTPPLGWTLTDLTCTASGDAGTTVSESGATATITMAQTGLVQCTYTNTLELGAIQVTKTRKHAAAGPGDHPHSGVNFTVNGVTKATDANGVACFDSLTFGDYTVHETVPAGYSGEADKTVTVNNNATCTDVPFGGETVAFHNTPLTDITVSVNSQVDGGTSSTITCVDSATPPIRKPQARPAPTATAQRLGPISHLTPIPAPWLSIRKMP